jgi:hypothetical protein
MNERRAAKRQRVFKAGTIEFDDSGVDCTIRNMSPIGAALDVASPVGISSAAWHRVAGQTRGFRDIG